MIHYLDNLEVVPIKVNGIDTATFCTTQTSYCGKTIHVKYRSEFSTRISGCTCEDCIKKYNEPKVHTFYCDNCKKIMSNIEMIGISMYDKETLYTECRK